MADKETGSESNNEKSNEAQISDHATTLENIVRQFQNTNLVSPQHKFWETQPVGQFKDVSDPSLPEGPIEDPKPISEVKQDPYNLPSAYEWTVCDMSSDEACAEVYTLLTNNYVEDDDHMFRFNYSKEFLRWALCSPGYFRNWHIGVRAKVSMKLVAFISGIPVKMRVRDRVFEMAEVNFLCVHKKLRSKRLAPVMIKEVTRRIHLENVWQAAYTAGVLLPTPMTTCQYWHRTLNPKKLVDIGFSRLDDRMTMSRYIKLYKLPPVTTVPGLRKMEPRDVPDIARLLRAHLRRFEVGPEFDDDDVAHWLLPKDNVVDCYVVEMPGTREVTDFFSFYTLPSSVLHNPNHSTLKAAYAFYYASTKTPLLQLVNDALIVAKMSGFDVFNALDVMENEGFLKELKFGPGDGLLYYYLYNYRFKRALKPSETGLVLL